MFMGCTYVKLDEKGRINLPVQYRSFFNSICLYMISPNYICISNTDIFNEILAFAFKMQQQDVSSNLGRLVCSHAFFDKIDKQGRIHLPQPLLEFAELEKEVIIVGHNCVLEIWQKDNFLKMRSSWPHVTHMQEQLLRVKSECELS